MNNFGVVELASTRTTSAPGWAYVPDTSLVTSAALPTNRKRAARNQPALSLSDLSARQEAKIRKELEALDRDGQREAVIPVPAKNRAAQTKHTPNVRKILQSQKTFANHLDDYQALLALAESNPPPAQSRAAQHPSATQPSASTASSKKVDTSSKKGDAASSGKASSSKKGASGKAAAPPPAPAGRTTSTAAKAAAAASKLKTVSSAADIDMPDAPPPPPPAPTSILAPYSRSPPAAHPGDADPLLVSRVPPLPTEEELRQLLDAPPLSYLEARAEWGEEEARYPVRQFCEVCGYWGRVKCMKCGTRVCALECLETHREDCVTRYGL